MVYYFSASKDQIYDQLKLALAWNRIDIVKSEIFVDDRTWTVILYDSETSCFTLYFEKI